MSENESREFHCQECGVHAELTERIADLRAWARSRIEQCRQTEQKFCANLTFKRNAQYPQTAIEAWTERRALEAVLRMLNGEESPR